MNKNFVVDSTCNNMRLDRWLRNKIGNIPQSLIEKYLRSGKIKINKKKVKSSFKIKTNDKIVVHNLDDLYSANHLDSSHGTHTATIWNR